ncbi:MAG: hypothetical protein V7K58_19515 [Nostoc sp.]
MVTERSRSTVVTGRGRDFSSPQNSSQHFHFVVSVGLLLDLAKFLIIDILKCLKRNLQLRGMGSGEWGVGDEGDEEDEGDEGDEENNLCPMPHAQCPMPNAQCPMPNP